MARRSRPGDLTAARIRLAAARGAWGRNRVDDTVADLAVIVLQVGNVLGVALVGLAFFSLLGSGHPGMAYATAFGQALPICAAALLVAAVLVHRLPVTPFEAQNALIERLPGWASGFA